MWNRRRTRGSILPLFEIMSGIAQRGRRTIRSLFSVVSNDEPKRQSSSFPPSLDLEPNLSLMIISNSQSTKSPQIKLATSSIDYLERIRLNRS